MFKRSTPHNQRRLITLCNELVGAILSTVNGLDFRCLSSCSRFVWQTRIEIECFSHSIAQISPIIKGKSDRDVFFRKTLSSVIRCTLGKRILINGADSQ